MNKEIKLDDLAYTPPANLPMWAVKELSVMLGDNAITYAVGILIAEIGDGETVNLNKDELKQYLNAVMLRAGLERIRRDEDENTFLTVTLIDDTWFGDMNIVQREV